MIRAGKSFELLATNKLDGAHMASAAVEGSALILRTDTHLYRIEDTGSKRTGATGAVSGS